MKDPIPITFSIPKEKIISEIPLKKKLLSTLIPGKLETYIYNNEKEYYDQYKESLFAITIKKAGWDCLRHYEIIACGCIPIFLEIENCPVNTLSLLPKELLLESRLLYEKLKNKDQFLGDININELNECYNLINKLLSYAKINLTTEGMARYILNKSSNINAKKILFLTKDVFPDYLRCLTLHGFKSLFGKNCHENPFIPHLYKLDNYDYHKLYGKGITYTNLLNIESYDINEEHNIEENIKNKTYDVIIYGSYHRGMPYYDLVESIYNPNQIIILCGEDIHLCEHKEYFLTRNYNLFIRELN